MSRKGLNKNERELYGSWEYVCKKSFWEKHSAYEGLPCDPKWRTFEGFVKDNWFRAYRAKIKWQNYIRVAPRDGREGKLKNKTTRFIRYKKELGFTKENTCFTSPSDMMKFNRTTHKYMFEKQMLGTRDIKNILAKRGIFIEMEVIVKRLKKGFDLFAPSEHCKLKWKGKFRSYVEIAEMEDIRYDNLKARHQRIDFDLRKAIDYCKQYEDKLYYFEGQWLRRYEICQKLSWRTGLSEELLWSRFSRFWGKDYNRLTAPLGYKGFTDVAKKVVAWDGKEEKEFNSAADAEKLLGVPACNISLVCSGKYVHAGGFLFMFKNEEDVEYRKSKYALYLLKSKISEVNERTGN